MYKYCENTIESIHSNLEHKCESIHKLETFKALF